MTPVELILGKLHGVIRSGSGSKARCPAHADDKASLSISEGDDGRALIHCHAGCTPLEVVLAVGLRLSDLMPSSNGKPRIVAEYSYCDESGKPLFQKVRFPPDENGKKGMAIRHRDSEGNWVWKIGDACRVLYRLPELLAADPSKPVLICEGEKDVERLRELGFVATCNFDGASADGKKPKWRDDYNHALRGRHVVIFPDNDPAGLAHADAVAASLRNVAASILIVRIPIDKPGGDISDWLDEPYWERGRDDVKGLMIRFRPGNRRVPVGPSAPNVATSPQAASGDAQRTLLDLTTAIIPLSDLAQQNPELRTPVVDGLLRRGEVLNLIAAPKIGKSWLAHSLALSVAHGRTWIDRYPTRPGSVLLVDNELHPETLAFRLRRVAEALGLTTAGVDVLPLRGRQMDYVSLKRTIDQIANGRYAVIVFDAHYRMLAGRSENDNSEIMEVYNLLDHFAAITGAALVLIHHASKGDQSGKDVSDVGAGAGAQSRATDTHLILRKHEEENCCVLEAVCRSFPTPEPVVLTWNAPLWEPKPDADPKQLETAETKKRKRNDDEGRQIVLAALARGERTANSFRAEGIGPDRARRILNQLIEEGVVEVKWTQIRGNETQVYSLRKADK